MTTAIENFGAGGRLRGRFWGKTGVSGGGLDPHRENAAKLVF